MCAVAGDGGLGETRPTAVSQSAPLAPCRYGALRSRWGIAYSLLLTTYAGGVNAAADDGGLGETRPTAVRKAHRRHGEVSAIVANPLATVKKNKKFKQLSS